MIRLLLLAVIIFAGILIGPSLMGHDTYVLIAINGWTLETSLVVMIMMVILFYALLQAAEWALINTIAMWGRTRHWFGWRKERIAQQKTIDGVLEFAAGHFSQAEQLSVNHVKHSKEPLLNYFTAINAAATQGKTQQRDEYIQQALEFAPDNTALIATKLKFLVEAGDYENAKSWLELQSNKVATHTDLLPLALKVREYFGEWELVIDLYDAMLKHRLITPPEHQAQIRRSYAAKLSSLNSLDLDAVTQGFKSIPRKYRNDIDIFCEYAKLVIKLDQAALIEKELFKRLTKQLSKSLLDVISQCPAKNANQWSERLIGFENYHNDTDFIDAIVQLSVLDRQWKTAKNWLLKSIKIDPSVLRYQKLAQIQQELGENGGALDSFNKALNFRLTKQQGS
ncbi:MAG: heme biosynthesis HemY N-terminal domain-containing protein [Psychrobium sp.]